MVSVAPSVNEAVISLFQEGMHWQRQIADLSQEATSQRESFVETEDPSAAVKSLRAEKRIQEIKDAAAAACLATMNNLAGIPLELVPTERGLQQAEAPIFDTFCYRSPIEPDIFGKQVRAEHYLSRPPKTFRGTIHRLGILNSGLELLPLKGHEARMNGGFYFARVLDDSGEPLIQVESITPRLTERVWPLTSMRAMWRA